MLIMYAVKKQLNFVILTSVLKEVFSKADFTIKNITYEIKDALHKIHVYMWKKEIGKIELFYKTHIPKTWKDHFKHKFRARRWLRWWIRRKPIQYFPIERITIFPDVEVPKGQGFETKMTYLKIVENGHTES